MNANSSNHNSSPILEVYAKLRQLGAKVKFHWVPGHSGIGGNEIADAWASNARVWLADVRVCVNEKEALVMPLPTFKSNEPATASILQIREGIKDFQYTLKMEDDLRSPPNIIFSKSTAHKLLDKAPKPFDKSSLNATLDRIDKSVQGPQAKALGEKVRRKPKANCSACKQIGHVRKYCQYLEPCGCCGKRGHTQKFCHEKLPCTVCDKMGHSWKVCSNSATREEVQMAQPDTILGLARAVSSELETVTIPEASLVVSLLHPTLVSQCSHGVRSRHVLGRVGLNPCLAPKTMFRPAVVLGFEPENSVE